MPVLQRQLHPGADVDIFHSLFPPVGSWISQLKRVSSIIKAFRKKKKRDSLLCHFLCCSSAGRPSVALEDFYSGQTQTLDATVPVKSLDTLMNR